MTSRPESWWDNVERFSWKKKLDIFTFLTTPDSIYFMSTSLLSFFLFLFFVFWVRNRGCLPLLFKKFVLFIRLLVSLLWFLPIHLFLKSHWGSAIEVFLHLIVLLSCHRHLICVAVMVTKSIADIRLKLTDVRSLVSFFPKNSSRFLLRCPAYVTLRCDKLYHEHVCSSGPQRTFWKRNVWCDAPEQCFSEKSSHWELITMANRWKRMTLYS